MLAKKGEWVRVAAVQERSPIGGERESVHVCPICRFTFRMIDPEAMGVACPGCNYLLRVEGRSLSQATSRNIRADHEEYRKDEWEREGETEVLEGKHRKISAFGILVIIMASVVWIFYFFKKESNKEKSADIVKVGKIDQELSLGARVKQVAREFLDAESLEVRWRAVNQSKITRELFDQYYQKIPKRKRKELLYELAQKQLEEHVTLLTYRKDKRKIRVFVGTHGGDALVDWESSVGYNKESIEDILGREEGTGVLRVRCEIGNYYDLTYTEEDWLCVEFSIFGHNYPIYGYINWNDDDSVSRLMEVLIDGDGEGMLEVRKLNNLDYDNRFLIESIPSTSWYQE